MKKITTLLFIVITYCVTSQTTTAISPVFPEILSQFPSVRDYTISSTHDEIYFTVQGYAGELSTIIKITKKDSNWSSPEIAPFSGQFDDLEAMFSPDGLKLFFVSNRPLENTDTKAKDYDIWYIKRSDITAKWSAPINIGNPINTKGDEFYPSVATNGNLYFTSTATASKGKDDIFVSTWQNNTYTNPVSLSEAINSEGYEYNSYIAPDESFLLFGAYKRKDGIGSGDLYISYRSTEGTWSKAKNLSAKINSDKMDYCPFYDSKTQILYFTSKRNEIITKRSKSLELKHLLKMMHSYQNGLSRIYKTHIKL